MKYNLDIRDQSEFFVYADFEAAVEKQALSYVSKLAMNLRYGLLFSDQFERNVKVNYLMMILNSIDIPQAKLDPEGIGYWIVESDFIVQND